MTLFTVNTYCMKLNKYLTFAYTVIKIFLTDTTILTQLPFVISVKIMFWFKTNILILVYDLINIS